MLLASGITVAVEPLRLPSGTAGIRNFESTIGETIEQNIKLLDQNLRELVENLLGNANHVGSLVLVHTLRLDRPTDSGSGC